MKNPQTMKKIELYNDSFQNWKKYLSCKAQLVICDPPYNLGNAGSAVVLRAAAELGWRAYGFEIKKEYCKLANEKILTNIQPELIF